MPYNHACKPYGNAGPRNHPPYYLLLRRRFSRPTVPVSVTGRARARRAKARHARHAMATRTKARTKTVLVSVAEGRRAPRWVGAYPPPAPEARPLGIVLFSLRHGMILSTVQCERHFSSYRPCHRQRDASRRSMAEPKAAERQNTKAYDAGRTQNRQTATAGYQVAAIWPAGDGPRPFRKAARHPHQRPCVAPCNNSQAICTTKAGGVKPPTCCFLAGVEGFEPSLAAPKKFFARFVRLSQRCTAKTRVC